MKKFGLVHALGISLALHIGIAYPSAPVREKRIIAKPALEVPDELKGKLTAQTLEIERKEHIRKTLADLKAGKHIKLSEFILKGEVLEMNIERAREGNELIHIEDIKREYEVFTKRARNFVEGREDPVKALHEFFHTEVLREYDYPNWSMIGAFTKGEYHCISAGLLFASVGEDFGIECKPVIIQGHLMCNVNGFDIDNTVHRWEDAKKPRGKCGALGPRDLFIAAYLVGNGVAIEELPKHLQQKYQREVLPECVGESEEGVVLDSKEKFKFPVRINEYVSGRQGTPPFYNPDYKKDNPESIVRMGRGLLAAYGLSHIGEQNTESGRYGVNVIDIPANVNWGRLMELGFGYSSALLMKYPERMLKCFPADRIIPETLPFLAELAGDKDNTKEEICRDYKRAIEIGSIQTVKDNATFARICSGVKKPLMDLYYRTEDKRILSALARLMLKENYPFFLGEFRKELGKEIRHEGTVLGLILSDQEKGCAELKKLPEEEKNWFREHLIVGCRSVEDAWAEIYRKGMERIRAVQIVDGPNMTKEQSDFLQKKCPEEEAPVKIMYGRLLYEAGYVHEAKSCFGSGVDDYSENRYGPVMLACDLPKELIGLLEPLYEKPEFAIMLAEGFMSSDLKLDEYPPAVLQNLKGVVHDENTKLEDRVNAAFLLLKLGIDPLN